MSTDRRGGAHCNVVPSAAFNWTLHQMALVRAALKSDQLGISNPCASSSLKEAVEEQLQSTSISRIERSVSPGVESDAECDRTSPIERPIRLYVDQRRADETV